MCSWISVSGRSVGAFLMSPFALAGAGTSCGRWRLTAQWNSDHHELLHAVTKQSFVDLVNRQWTIGRKYGRNTRSYRWDIQRTIFTTTTAAMDEPKYTCTETRTCSATTAAVSASAVTTHTTAKSPYLSLLLWRERLKIRVGLFRQRDCCCCLFPGLS